MTIAFLLALALIAALFNGLKWRRASITLGVVAGLAFLATGYGLPARALLGNLQDGYDTDAHVWGNHNAIILLGAGSQLSDRNTVEITPIGYSRMVRALQVYHACRAHSGDCKIIASGGYTHRFDTSEAEVFGTQLRAAGVPPDDLLIEKRSLNTWQNAQFSAALFEHDRFDQTFLVTSGVHLPRSILYFSYFGIRATPIRADYGRPVTAVLPRASNFVLTDAALHEYVGIWRYYVYNALGWNARPAKPGTSRDQ
jgi:uncharacterized SAM-binding protein YcdF (DUF218 family)